MLAKQELVNWDTVETKCSLFVSDCSHLYFVNWYLSTERFIMCCKYFRYLHKTNIFVFRILSAIRPAKFQLSSTIIGRVSIFGYVIYSSADIQYQQCASAEE